MAKKAAATSEASQGHPRCGVYRQQPSGYRAFIPNSLPVQPPIDFGAIEPELSAANLAVGRLDAIAGLVPDPDLFVRMYVRKEAVLSSRIEGTQASLSDVLEDEADVAAHGGTRPEDVREVRNYVDALNAGLERLTSLPLSLRLIREMHAMLMTGVRGGDRAPGEFRRSQNWIGPGGCSLEEAIFVPPPAQELAEHLGNLEAYIRAEDSEPVLVRAGVAHVQFETIHPFLDGNGRLGRLLITFILCERKVLQRPLLYLSAFFTANKQAYYHWLMRVRMDADWEGWLRFYLRGVEHVARQAVQTAQRILALQQEHRTLLQSRLPNKPNALRLLEALALRPVITVKSAAGLIDVTVPTANQLVGDLEALGILRETSGRERDRVFRYQSCLDVLAADAPDVAGPGPV